MICRTIVALSTLTALGACATSRETPNNFTAERTSLGSPYVAPVLARGQIGSESGLPYMLVRTGRGVIAYDHKGNRVDLSRQERRVLERQLGEQDARDRLPPPADPPAPPTAATPGAN